MPEPVDQPTDITFALEGRVVTMDEPGVIERGVVYVDKGIIVDVLPERAKPPAGFAGVKLIRSRGTIYPGLIELHNHLPYNVLQLWQVPKKFERREQWRSDPEKRRLVTAPMRILGETEGFIQAVIRYVECKCLVAGVTTSQGITLFSAQGSQRFYKGIVRNVEQTDDPRLPEARTKVADVEAQDVEKFFERLQRSSCLLLHLSEGVDERARAHFLRLQRPSGEWAIAPALAGIHSLGLMPNDLKTFGRHGGAVVWSPLSNMLLYGETLDLAAVKSAGIRVGLGSDWSPTGSKSLFGELKVARLVNEAQGGVFSDQELVAMVTTNAADILGWSAVLGSLTPGKFADLVVISGRRNDPFAHLIKARETGVSLVVIHGVPRCGWPSLMRRFGQDTEKLRIGRATRRLNLHQETADPMVAGLTLKAAIRKLRTGMANLHNLASEREVRFTARARGVVPPRGLVEPQWSLLLDNDAPEDLSVDLGIAPMGTGLSTPGGPSRTERMTASAITQETEAIEIALDDLTVADDSSFLKRLAAERNLPEFVKRGLPKLY